MTDDTRKVPLNTESEAREAPIIPLARAMAVGPGNSIYQQEADGQQSFVNSETLPTEIRRYGDVDSKTILEAAGVKFLGAVEGDPLFQHVELPAGWKKVATEHSMHSDLVDDKGRKRAAIFYKAAFYDRRADMNLTCRFGVRTDYERQNNDGVAVAIVTAGGETIHTTDPIDIQNSETPWNEGDQATKTAIEWLNQEHPDWRNPGAYWD